MQQPVRVLQQRFGAGQALDRNRFGNRLPAIVRQVPLPPQGIEHYDAILIKTQRQCHGLDHRLVVARTARQGTAAVRIQCCHSNLHDRLVGDVESVFRAKGGQLCVGEISSCGRQ